MNFPSYIARRYLFAKKSHNIINIITGISVVGVSVGTLALIVVLSVFNGFEGLVKSLYNSFYPDIHISLHEGKYFHMDDFPQAEIKQVEGVKYFCEVLEENVLLKYGEKQDIVTLKGVSNTFRSMSGVDSMIVDGSFVLEESPAYTAVLGYLVSYKLEVDLRDYSKPIQVYLPLPGKMHLVDPLAAFNQTFVYPAGIFSIQQDFDSKYVIVPIELNRKLLYFTREVTAIELGLEDYAAHSDVQQEIQEILGENYVVKNRFQQHEVLYKIMKSEKLGIYLILSFILFIATFNIIGSLSMLIIDKSKDIAILKSLGAENTLIKRIFLLEGLMISLAGALSGLFLGAVLCLIQMKFGLIRLQSGDSFVISAYPVELRLEDFVSVFIIVLLIGLGAAWYPVKQISAKYLRKHL